MEETGVLVNLDLLGLVLPDFEPGPKKRHSPPFLTPRSEPRLKPIAAAVGQMSRRAAWATDQIAEARSESVRLAALRSTLSDMMAVADFARLEQRIAKLEEQDRVWHEQNATAAN